MTQEQHLKNLTSPNRRVDVVLDTDACAEIDDQFAISYMLRKTENFNVKGICAAPFADCKTVSATDGMNKSYDEILHILRLLGKEELGGIVFRGSKNFLTDEDTPEESQAASFIADLAKEYSPENPLYIVAIGAITNVASAILKNPQIKENCVVVWLGGHAMHMPMGASEFNMKHDISAARIVFGCGVPLVQLPCRGVVDNFATSRYELEHWLKGKNPLCDYLCENTIKQAESYAAGKPWTRVIWDVAAVAWLLNGDSKFMSDMLIPSPIPEYRQDYSFDEKRHLIRYVYRINRDALFEDLFKVLSD